MKILWLTENYPPSKGGMAQSCDRIIANLRRQGVGIDIVHFSNRRKAFITEKQLNGSYTATPIYRDMAHTLNLTYSYLDAHVDTAQYDFMMVYGGFMPMSASIIFSQFFELPYYVCVRGNDFDISLFSYKRRPMLLDAMRSSMGVLSVCASKIERVIKLLPQLPAHFTPNGIELEEWFALASESNFAADWRKLHCRSGQLVFGLFGVLKDKKGVDYFLKALKLSGKSSEAILLFSGELQASVLELLDEYQLSYHALPFLARSELLKYYLVCDWIVIPSLYEGMPNVMLEAGGLGVPVLATDVDGMRDVIETNHDGILYKPLRNQDCVQAIQYCFAMPEPERLRMGMALKKKICSNYTPEQEAQKYLTVFKGDGFNV